MRCKKSVLFWLLLSAVPASSTEYSFWRPSAIPASSGALVDGQPVTLGLRFSVEMAGRITAIRYFKGSNSGVTVGALWSATGEKLAEAFFNDSEMLGWQQAAFPAPVSIQEKTTYIVSYFAPSGHYAHTSSYSWEALNSPPLKVEGESPGVFSYGGDLVFPAQSYNRTNYWVDVVFEREGCEATQHLDGIHGSVTGGPATLDIWGVDRGSIATDADGNFRVTGYPDGLYFITPRAVDRKFQPLAISTFVKCGSTMPLLFKSTSMPGYVPHSASLSWTRSVSPNIAGYNIYRSGTSQGPYLRMNLELVPGAVYVDPSVQAGVQYFYVVTAVNGFGVESDYSNEAAAKAPAP